MFKVGSRSRRAAGMAGCALTHGSSFSPWRSMLLPSTDTHVLVFLCQWSHSVPSAFLELGFVNSSKTKLLPFGSSQGNCSGVLPVASTFLILVSWGLGFHVEISVPTRLLVDWTHRKSRLAELGCVCLSSDPHLTREGWIMALFYPATVAESRSKDPTSSVFLVFSFTNPLKAGLSLWLCHSWSGRVLHLSNSVIVGSLCYRCTCAFLDNLNNKPQGSRE